MIPARAALRRAAPAAAIAAAIAALLLSCPPRLFAAPSYSNFRMLVCQGGPYVQMGTNYSPTSHTTRPIWYMDVGNPAPGLMGMTEPGTVIPGTQALYHMDGGAGPDATDSSAAGHALGEGNNGDTGPIFSCAVPPDTTGVGHSAASGRFFGGLTYPVNTTTCVMGFSFERMKFNQSVMWTADNLFKNSFSVEAWIKNPRAQSAVTVPQPVEIFEYAPGSNIYLTVINGTTPCFSMAAEPSLCGAPAALNDGAWHHVVFTFDVASLKRTIYVNGNLNGQDATAVSGPYTGTSPTAMFGKGFGGTIDELRILNYALSADQVAAHYFGQGWKLKTALQTTLAYGGGLGQQTSYGATTFTHGIDHSLQTYPAGTFPVQAGFFSEDTAENLATLNLTINLNQTNLTAPALDASSVTAISNNAITWSWGSGYVCNSAQTTYQVQLIDNGAAGAWTSNGASSAYAPALSPNRAYGVSVIATYTDTGGSGLIVGPSAPTLTLYATTYASVPGAPVASMPTSGTSVSVTTGTLAIPNPAVTEYELWSSLNGASYALSASYSATSPRTLSPLAKASNYRFQTKARNLAGIVNPTLSPASNLIVTQPDAPTLVVGTPNAAGCPKTELLWTWNPSATGSGSPPLYYPGGIAGTSIVQTGLSPGVQYSRSVYANDAGIPFPNSDLITGYGTTGAAGIEMPNPPAGTPATTTSITWTWTPVVNACSPSYKIFDALTSALLGSTGVGVVTWSQTGLTANTLYSNQINANDAYDPGSAKSGTGRAYTLANDPTALTLTGATTGSVTLGWTSSNPAYTRFVVTYSADAFATATSTRVFLTDDFTGTSVGIGGLQSGINYSFRVQAFNGRSSDYVGDVGSAKVPVSGWTRPQAPAVSGAAGSSTQIVWSWASVAGAAGYRLYAAGGAPLLVDTPGLSYPQTGLGINSEHGVEIEAYNASGTGPRSGPVYTYTQAVDPVSPVIAAVNVTSVSYSWGDNGNPGYTFYEVNVAADPLFAAVVTTLTVNARTATVTGLVPDTLYYARLRAVSGSQAAGNIVAIAPTRTLVDPAITYNQAPPSAYIPPSGAVGQWNFDESTGVIAADSSGLGNTAYLTCAAAACVSTPTFVAGPSYLGSAVAFSGLNDGLVRVPDTGSYAFTDSLTVSAWVNPLNSHQPDGTGLVVRGNGGAENFALDISGGLYRFMPTPAKVAASTNSIAAGTWTHLIGVYDSAVGTATLYVNGRPASTVLGVPARTAAAHDISIGNRQAGAAAYDRGFAGRIDAVRVQHRALSAAEALAEYQGSFVSTIAPLSPNNAVLIGLAPNAFGAPATVFVSLDPILHPIKITPAVLNTGLTVLPTGYTLVPNGIVEVVPIVGGSPFTHTLGSSASISMPYADADGNNMIDGTNPPLTASKIQVYTLNTTVNRWEALPTLVDPASRRVTVFTPHFSVFAMLAPLTVGTSLSEVRVYPIPWKPGTLGRFDAAGITFDRLPVSGTVRILSLAGERVRELPFDGSAAGSVSWDGQTDGGRRAASGVYFARITAGGGSVSVVKFAIER